MFLGDAYKMFVCMIYLLKITTKVVLVINKCFWISPLQVWREMALLKAQISSIQSLRVLQICLKYLIFAQLSCSQYTTQLDLQKLLSEWMALELYQFGGFWLVILCPKVFLNSRMRTHFSRMFLLEKFLLWFQQQSCMLKLTVLLNLRSFVI